MRWELRWMVCGATMHETLQCIHHLSIIFTITSASICSSWRYLSSSLAILPIYAFSLWFYFPVLILHFTVMLSTDSPNRIFYASPTKSDCQSLHYRKTNANSWSLLFHLMLLVLGRWRAVCCCCFFVWTPYPHPVLLSQRANSVLYIERMSVWLCGWRVLLNALLQLTLPSICFICITTLGPLNSNMNGTLAANNALIIISQHKNHHLSMICF